MGPNRLDLGWYRFVSYNHYEHNWTVAETYLMSLFHFCKSTMFISNKKMNICMWKHLNIPCKLNLNFRDHQHQVLREVRIDDLEM